MRIIDYINDPVIKITIFEYNERYTIQCEDRDVSLSYRYPQSEISLDQIKQSFNPAKINWIKNQLKRMRIEKPYPQSYVPNIEFEEII